MADAVCLAEYAQERLLLQHAKLPEDYFYASLPLCVIDAVWSLGVNYKSVLNVVTRYCEKTGVPRFRKPDEIPAVQETVSGLVARLDALNAEQPADAEPGQLAASERLFDNRKPTSRQSGILKAEAVRRFAVVLHDHGLERLEDALEAIANPAANDGLERAIRDIPGQGSGISLTYFWMLAGDESRIKPDTMVIRFLQSALDRKVQEQEAQPLLTDAAAILRADHPQMTPRLLDHLIWRYQRSTHSARVLAFLPIIEAPEFVAHTARGGYPDYHPIIIPLLRSLDDVDPYAKLPEDPPGTNPRHLLRERAEIVRATEAQVLRYLAQLLRGERFGDGYIANEFDEGRVLAALHRLRDLASV